MRSYGVLPSKLTATGPKGYLVKGDVLKYIKTNNLSLRPRETNVVAVEAAVPAQEQSAPSKPKKQAPKKKQSKGASAASPAYNPNDPFQ